MPSSCSRVSTGFAGWQDLTAEASKRLGKGLERAAAQARRLIQDNDVERLKQLLAEYPAILSWRGDDWDRRAACWESPRAPMPTASTRTENGPSPARRAPNC